MTGGRGDNGECRHFMDDDAATSPQASYVVPEFCPVCGKNMDGDACPERQRKMMEEVAAGLVALLVRSQNPLMTARAIPFAFGLPTAGMTEKDAAQELMVTKSAFNKEVLRLQGQCQSRVTRHNRPLTMRAKLSQKMKDNHWRNDNAIDSIKSVLRRVAKGHANGKRAQLRQAANV